MQGRRSYKNLGLFLVILLIIAALFATLPMFRRLILGGTNLIKEEIYAANEGTLDYFDRHIGQSEKIASLQNEVRELNAKMIYFEYMSERLKELAKLSPLPHEYASVIPVLAYSYVGIGNYNKVWLNTNMKNIKKDKLYGLVRNNLVLGIAKRKDNGLMGILNGNSKVSYSVAIGSQRAPGMVVSNGALGIKIDFIPIWMDINVGDEVVTSGLDGIFFEGLKVGVIEGVSSEYGYKVASIKEYAKRTDLGYLYLIDLDYEAGFKTTDIKEELKN